ncbi:MAG: hypothetical protein IKD90_05245 [Clostridiales bacterium]|nr:hypothetical protein [Clostridiales bacterium]
MDISLVIRTILAFGGLIGCVVLLFIGFGKTIKFLKKEDRSTSVPKDILIKSTLLIIAALALMIVSFVASKYNDVTDGVCTFSELVLSYVVHVVKSYGWIAAIPFLLNLMRRTSRPNYNDTDKM